MMVKSSFTRKEKSKERDTFDGDVTMKGFFEVGSRQKTTKLSQSIFTKEIPTMARKPEVFKQSWSSSKNESIFRNLIPKSAKRSHNLYREFAEFENKVRNSENVTIDRSFYDKENVNNNGFCINSLAFDPEERFSWRNLETEDQ
mgnify:CR=1 FL=1